jgi:membrane protease YdiL (CAAX protease family)
MHVSRQQPPRRWSLPLLLSILLSIGSVFSVIVGVLSRQPSFLLFGIGALAASFAAISVGWALDFRLGITEGRWRIRAMHWFFNTVVGVCLGLAVVDAGR